MNIFEKNKSLFKSNIYLSIDILFMIRGIISMVNPLGILQSK